MNPIISTLLDGVQLGEPVTDEGLTLVPVFGEFACMPEFVTLVEAIAAKSLVVTEVSESGSVPTLKAHNTGPTGVLLLDGEELIGALQNRVLNTSVYIKPGQEIVIPVSCTEHGRWRYSSAEFGDSGHVSACAVRSAAHHSVTANLRRAGSYRSDQGRVWAEVGLLQKRHAVASPTSAARDVYEARSEAVRRREEVFTCAPGQIGILALWRGRVVGFDVVGRAQAYAMVHSRLVRSYALDAPTGASSSVDQDRSAAKNWLTGLGNVTVTEHESPGNGMSYRFTSAHTTGSALAVDGAILHAVAFSTHVESNHDEDRYPGFFERRANFPW
jgi:hypothetical protein